MFSFPGFENFEDSALSVSSEVCLSGDSYVDEGGKGGVSEIDIDKTACQCEGCHQAVVCGKKELVIKVVELIAGWEFLSVSCKHFKGTEKPLELPAFLKNKKGA